MENISEIQIPNFPLKEKEEIPEKKKIKKILDVKERLTKVNRNVKCIFCNTERILNPDQYQAYYDYWGTEEKIEKEFFCKPCDVAQKENPVKFWISNCDPMKKLFKNIKVCFDLYRISNRGPQDITALQNMSVNFLKQNNITEANCFEFVIEQGLPSGMKIKNIPFVGNIQLNVYASNPEYQIVLL